MENTAKGNITFLFKLDINVTFNIHDFVETIKEQIMWRNSII